MTRQRQLIYNIIQRADDHPTAEMIYARAKAEMPSIAFGTVYRNLKLMVDAGEILHIPVAGEPDRYDKTIRPHEHMQCIECGRVADCDPGDLKSYFSSKIGEEIVSYTLNFFYICNECRQKRKRRIIKNEHKMLTGGACRKNKNLWRIKV